MSIFRDKDFFSKIFYLILKYNFNMTIKNAYLIKFHTTILGVQNMLLLNKLEDFINQLFEIWQLIKK